MRPGLLGERDERERRDEPAGRVLPADERLEPDDPAGREVDDRLVVEPQLVALERAAQVVLELDPLERLRRSSTARTGRLATRRVAPWPGPSRSRPRGAARRACPAGLRHRDARADALMNQSRPSSGNGALQLGEDPLGDPTRLLGVGDRVEDERELVAAEAGDRVARAEAVAGAAGRPP